MRRTEDGYFFSATDLATHLACAHRTQLERARYEADFKKPHFHNPHVELLQELGDRHERAYLEQLRTDRTHVVELPAMNQDLSATIDAMKSGADVIFQAYLNIGPWRGYADFLLKVDTPSQLGDWSYEVADTKLSQTTKATAVLQLCLYTQLVTELQGVQPNQMHVVRPGNLEAGEPFSIDRLRVDDFIAYYRAAKRRFEDSMAAERDVTSYPARCSHCSICDWWKQCDDRWREDDHLNLVAGIRQTQMEDLAELEITTLQGLAEADLSDVRPERGSKESLRRVHHQAQVQYKGRVAGEPTYEFQAVADGCGFLRLPAPSPGDVFYDIEGHKRGVGTSLEYLFGYSVILPTSAVRKSHARWRELAKLAWNRNAEHEVVTFAFDRRDRLVGQIRHQIEHLDLEELEIYVTALLRECDRFAYLLTGEEGD